MLYQRSRILNIAYELPDEVISTKSLEQRLESVYKTLGIPMGQVEALSKITSRRVWPENFSLAECAAKAASRALVKSDVSIEQVQMLIYAGVGRDQLEPATACEVGYRLKLPATATVFDLSNACLGVINGIIQVATAIEQGSIEYGLVVSAESSREIVDSMIEQMHQQKDFQHFVYSLATLTGGSGAVAVLLGSNAVNSGHQLVASATRQSLAHHQLCYWGKITGGPSQMQDQMHTDSSALLKYGIDLAIPTYQGLLQELPWSSPPEKFICHQVGEANQKAIRQALGFSQSQEFITYPYLGNTGTVALPLTAAIAAEEGFLQSGDRVALLGIGSGLTCLMMAIQW